MNQSRLPKQQFIPKLDCFGLTDRGRVRAENQDAFLVDAEAGLFIVSDGMGGHQAGRLASQIVVTVLPALIREPLSGIVSVAGVTARDRVKAALVRLSAEMRSRTEGVAGLEGMGATVVLALGLTNMVSDRELFEVLGMELSPEKVCKRLVAAANKAAGMDNVTVVHLAV